MSNPKPSSPPSSFLSSNNKTNVDLPKDDEEQLHRLPTLSESLEEIKAIGKISGPIAISSLLLYSRAMISMLFLGYLGEFELAGGSLAIGFANITGYSVISGLAMGMEPICGQAYGAKQWKVLGLTLQRTVLLLISASVPIYFMWVNMKGILLWCGQDQEISSVAHTFIIFSLPDLLLLSLLHPLRIYLRTQSITLPVTYCSAISVLLHVPLNFLLIVHFKLGVAGVAMAMVWTNLNLLLLLSSFVYFSGVYKDSWVTPSTYCLRGWSSLLAVALPTCASVCLEWWWYEFMILLCGLLVNPKATVTSMGILIQTTSLVYCFPSALSVGVSTRVGNELGANRPGKARISMIISLFCAVAIGLVAMLFTTLMRHEWGKFFTSDVEILELTAVALPIAGLCELGNCPQTTGCGVLRGSARPTIGANINLGSFYLVGMPVSILIGFMTKMGFAGLWLGLLAAQASCAFFMLLVLCKTDWMLQVERARLLTQTSTCGLLLYPRATFGDGTNDDGIWKSGASSSEGGSSNSSDDDEDDGDNDDGIWKSLPEFLRKRLEDLCRSNPKLCNMLNGIWESLPESLRTWLEDKLAAVENNNDGISRFLESLWEWLEEGWFTIGKINKHLKEIYFISTIGKAAWEWRYYLFILAGLIVFLWRKHTTKRKNGKKGKKDKKKKPKEKAEDSENGRTQS